MNNYNILRKLKAYLLCVPLLSMVIIKGYAQEGKPLSRSLGKYELSIDMGGFIYSYGYPSKILFKIYDKRGDSIKGAYRLGISADYTYRKKTDMLDGQTYSLLKKTNDYHFSVLVGYEKHKYTNSLLLYYGLDTRLGVGFTDVKKNIAGDSKYYGLDITPFFGGKHFFTKHLSLACELGLRNHISYSKDISTNPNYRYKEFIISSKLLLPYSFTLNYHF
ncbi:hypothetical protein MNBD_BACTEROID01-2632 [hydrothermal vent metagenome]|uniref:Outer membrane protein beta-barrel domain-containing protein n=1 Tax=hydrothermal vent metagenome TaxID=652676 RepID=A0A3B0TTD0_9ZZZZ